MGGGEPTQTQCLLWIIQTAKFSGDNVHLSSMTILHVPLQKKAEICPQTSPASSPFPRRGKLTAQQGPRVDPEVPCVPSAKMSGWKRADSLRSICTDLAKQASSPCKRNRRCLITPHLCFQVLTPPRPQGIGQPPCSSRL